MAKFRFPQVYLSTGCGFVDKLKEARKSAGKNPRFLAGRPKIMQGMQRGEAGIAGGDAEYIGEWGFSPQGCGWQRELLHNLSNPKKPGGSRAAATFPQFPQALLLLLFNNISTSTILVLGAFAYGKEGGCLTLSEASGAGFSIETEVPICSLPSMSRSFWMD